jgi:hypothetical protein
MRLGKLWFAVAACLLFSGIVSAQVPDPILVLGGDPAGSPIEIFNTQNFNFTINFGNCTANCTVTDLFQNDTGSVLDSITFNFAGGGLSCNLSTGQMGQPPAQDFYTTCATNPALTSVTFSGLDATHPGIASAVYVDTDHDGDGGANCNQDDTWTGGEFSLQFGLFNPGPSHHLSFIESATTSVPEPAGFGLLFSGLGALIAGYKRSSGRRTA